MQKPMLTNYKMNIELGRKLGSLISDLELSVRTSMVFRRERVRYVEDVVKHTEEELLNYKGFGKRSLQEIKELVSSIGLELGMKNLPKLTKIKDLPLEEKQKLPIMGLNLTKKVEEYLSRNNINSLGDLVSNYDKIQYSEHEELLLYVIYLGIETGLLNPKSNKIKKILSPFEKELKKETIYEKRITRAKKRMGELKKKVLEYENRVNNYEHKLKQLDEMFWNKKRENRDYRNFLYEAKQYVNIKVQN